MSWAIARRCGSVGRATLVIIWPTMSPTGAAQSRSAIAVACGVGIPRSSAMRSSPGSQRGEPFGPEFGLQRPRGDEDLHCRHARRIEKRLPGGIGESRHPLIDVRDVVDSVGEILDRGDERVDGVVDHCGQQPLTIPEVVLDNPGADPGAGDDVPGAGRRKTLFTDASDGFLDHQFPCPVRPFLTRRRARPGRAPVPEFPAILSQLLLRRPGDGRCLAPQSRLDPMLLSHADPDRRPYAVSACRGARIRSTHVSVGANMSPPAANTAMSPPGVWNNPLAES